MGCESSGLGENARRRICDHRHHHHHQQQQQWSSINYTRIGCMRACVNTYILSFESVGSLLCGRHYSPDRCLARQHTVSNEAAKHEFRTEKEREGETTSGNLHRQSYSSSRRNFVQYLHIFRIGDECIHTKTHTERDADPCTCYGIRITLFDHCHHM